MAANSCFKTSFYVNPEMEDGWGDVCVGNGEKGVEKDADWSGIRVRDLTAVLTRTLNHKPERSVPYCARFKLGSSMNLEITHMLRGS